MRKYDKNQCKDLIRTLEEAHEEIAKYISKKEMDTAVSLLEQCQQAAIAIGGIVESSEGEGTEVVSRLEAYCELTYNIHEELMSGARINPTQTEKKLKKIVRSAQNSINSLPTKYEAVFLPYKASMWDSLESIWMAANEDENCDAYVIPIPYYDKKPDGSFAKLHYEADQYPEYVPVVNYGRYDFAERHPDMIFIHNPYDGWNYVTSIHPNFYTDKLKEQTDCLVYVPYFATSGVMNEGQRFIPSYLNMDYIVVQSKAMIDQYDRRVPREKFLPLGSPKFDRVIRLCKNLPEPSVEWKKKMEGKRVYFYNTSIAGMLDDTGKFLRKMAYVFNTVKEVDDACILWRPHPLLESTFDSMRTEFKFVYEMLTEAFMEEGFGIYDTTPDIEESIALSDAYIGDAGTSVISLFETAGKPIFLLNNKITELPPEDFWKGQYFQTIRSDGQNHYCILRGKELYAADAEIDKYHYRYVQTLVNERRDGQYATAVLINGKTYICPRDREDVRVMDSNGNEKILPLRHRDTEFGKFANCWIYENYLLIVANQYPDWIRINTDNDKVDYIAGIGNYAKYTVDDSVIWASRLLWRGKIFLLDPQGTKLKMIDIKTLQVTEREMPFHRLITWVCSKEADEDVLWAIPYEGTVITKWDTVTDTFTDYDLTIEGLQSISRKDGSKCEVNYFSNVTQIGKDMIVSPHWGNKFIRLNPDTGDVSEWHPPFPIMTEDRDEYFTNWGMGYFYTDAQSKENYYFHAPLRKTYHLNKDLETCEEVDVSFQEDEIYRLARGFDTDEQGHYYFCCEDGFNTIQRMIRNQVAGAVYDREKQQESLRGINSSPQGDCGQKVFEYLREI